RRTYSGAGSRVARRPACPRCGDHGGRAAGDRAGWPAGAAVLARAGAAILRSTVARVLMALPLPQAPVPNVLSVDDIALRRGTATHSCSSTRSPVAGGRSA